MGIYREQKGKTFVERDSGGGNVLESLTTCGRVHLELNRDKHETVLKLQARNGICVGQLVLPASELLCLLCSSDKRTADVAKTMQNSCKITHSLVETHHDRFTAELFAGSIKHCQDLLPQQRSIDDGWHADVERALRVSRTVAAAGGSKGARNLVRGERARLDDRTAPARADKFDARILDGEVLGHVGKDAVQEGVRRLLCMMANIVVRTDLGRGGHELNRESVSTVRRDARVVRLRLGAIRIRVEEERLCCFSELIEGSLGSLVREVRLGIGFQLAVARSLTRVDGIARNICMVRRSRRRESPAEWVLLVQVRGPWR